MNKKKTRKSKAAKSVRDLPAKTLKAKAAKGVRGGFVAVEHGTTSPKPSGGNVSAGFDLIGAKVPP